MKKSLIIKRFLAAFFLLLFSFCVTPKRFLHDLLANHKDAPLAAGQPFEQIATTGFHCHVDELVVMEPFLPGLESQGVQMLSSTPLHFCEPLQGLIFSCPERTDGRGPPSFMA
jgi:hypothetical protein